MSLELIELLIGKADFLSASWMPGLPIVLPLLGAALAAFCFDRAEWQQRIGMVTLSFLVISTGILFATVWLQGPVAMAAGGWPSPFGIVLVADILGAGLTFLSSIIMLAAAIYIYADEDDPLYHKGFTPMLLTMAGGISGAFLTGDLFNLYVWFEVVLISSFGLIALGGRREQVDGAIKYAFLNLLATSFILLATGMLYGLTGSLNIAALALEVAGMEQHMTILTSIALILILAYAMKAAAFPLMFWLPSSYHTTSPGVTAVFAALLTKIGVYAMYRIFIVIFPNVVMGQHLILILGLTSIIYGAIGALVEFNIRRLAGYLVISGVGVMLTGLGLGSFASLHAGLFYMAHSMLALGLIFLVLAVSERIAGTRSLHIAGGLLGTDKMLGVIGFIAILAMMGLPPLTGFWPKLALLQAALAQGLTGIVFFILAGSLIKMIALGRLWAGLFWRPAPEGASLRVFPTEKRRAMFGPIMLLAGIVILLGVFPEPLSATTERAALWLTDRDIYIRASLTAGHDMNLGHEIHDIIKMDSTGKEAMP